MGKGDEMVNVLRQGSLFVVSAPSGAGKTTLCKMLCDSLENIKHSVSFTTRPPREGEVNDVDYSFIDKETFLEMASKGEFIEWAEVHGNHYGTSRKRIEDMKSVGRDVIMDIDTQGARQLMDNDIEATFIFILPPSFDELRRRLEARKTDPDEVIRKRLMKAREEIGDYKRYEYVIINSLLESALDDLEAIVKADRNRLSRFDDRWIENFLKEVS